MRVCQALGNQPLQPILARIENISTVEELQLFFVDALQAGGPQPFHMEVSLGFRDKERNSLFLKIAGLSMPEAFWHDVGVPAESFDVTSRGAQNKSATVGKDAAHHRHGRAHILTFFTTLNLLAGSTRGEADLAAQQTLSMETMLAQWRVDEPRFDDPLGPELTSLLELISLCPNMPCKMIFENMAADCSAYNYLCNEQLLHDHKLIINAAPAFFGNLNTALGNASLLNTSPPSSAPTTLPWCTRL